MLRLAEMGSVQARVAALDWQAVTAEVVERGFSDPRVVLGHGDCRALRELFVDDARFRQRVDMGSHRFGRGHYGYFAEPLPPLVTELRASLYVHCRAAAEEISRRLDRSVTFPATFAEYQTRCQKAGQTLPTPLLLRYRAGDYNRLHQDIYGREVFPLQCLIALSQVEEEFSGGENLFLQIPSVGQARGFVCRPTMGEAVVFCSNEFPIVDENGTLGAGSVQHGLSPLHAGERFTLGIVFHNAEPDVQG